LLIKTFGTLYFFHYQWRANAMIASCPTLNAGFHKRFYTYRTAL